MCFGILLLPPTPKNSSLTFSLILDIHLIGNQISRGDEIYHAKTPS